MSVNPIIRPIALVRIAWQAWRDYPFRLGGQNPEWPSRDIQWLVEFIGTLKIPDGYGMLNLFHRCQ